MSLLHVFSGWTWRCRNRAAKRALDNVVGLKMNPLYVIVQWWGWSQDVFAKRTFESHFFLSFRILRVRLYFAANVCYSYVPSSSHEIWKLCRRPGTRTTACKRFLRFLVVLPTCWPCVLMNAIDSYLKQYTNKLFLNRVLISFIGLLFIRIYLHFYLHLIGQFVFY